MPAANVQAGLRGSILVYSCARLAPSRALVLHSLSRPPEFFARLAFICRQYIPRDGKIEPGGTNWRSCLALAVTIESP
jgi:hypothetical protein